MAVIEKSKGIKAKIREYILYNLLSHWTFVGPLMTGVVAFAGKLFGAEILPESLLPLFSPALAASFIATIVAPITRLYLYQDEITEEVKAEVFSQVDKSQEAALDDLHELLSQDNDPRDEQLLDGLRKIHQAFQQGGTSWVASSDALDIQGKANNLFNICVLKLTAAYKLLEQAHTIQIASAQKPFLEERETILKEVKKSVEDLSHVLTQFLRIDVQSQDGISELKTIRDGLNTSLEIAQEVDEEQKQLYRLHHRRRNRVVS